MNFTPTPTLRWDSVPAAVAYRIYWRWLPDGGWCCNSGRLDCQVIPNEDSGGSYTICPGVDYDVPVQRYTSTQLEELAFCVKAIDAEGDESLECSNEIAVCMTRLWQPGQPYE